MPLTLTLHLQPTYNCLLRPQPLPHLFTLTTYLFIIIIIITYYTAFYYLQVLTVGSGMDYYSFILCIVSALYLLQPHLYC